MGRQISYHEEQNHSCILSIYGKMCLPLDFLLHLLKRQVYLDSMIGGDISMYYYTTRAEITLDTDYSDHKQKL